MKHTLIGLACACAAAAPQAATFVWSSGSFVAGTTAPDPLAAGDVLDITGAATKSFGAGVVWTNNGTVNFAPAVGVSIGSGASVTHHGLWDLQSDFGLSYSGGGASFTSTGTLRKSAGSGTSSFSGSGLAFDHRGTLEAQTGTLRIDTPLAVFRDGARYRGAGRVEVTSSARFEGTQDSENLALAGGTNRTWTGADAVVQGRLSWETGSLAGTWRVAAGQVLAMEGAGSRGVAGATLVNDGTVAWANATSVGLSAAALVRNRALWDAQADGSIAINGGAQFINDATLRKSGGSSTTTFTGSAAFINNGTLDVQTGTLQIASTANQFAAGSLYQGAGRVLVSASSTFTGLQQTQNLVLGGGSNRAFTGAGAVIQGQLGWESGSFTGTWTLGAGQLLRTTGAGSTGFSGAGTVFTNRGTIEWAGTGNVRLGQGATLANEGLIELQANVDIVNTGGGGTLRNRGRIEKQAAGDATINSVGLTLDNTGGVIDVQAGSLRLPNGYVDRGTLTGDGAFIVINKMATEGTLAPGSHGIGTLALDGDDGVTLRPGSTLAIDLNSTASHDRLVVNQAFTLGGTLALNCWADCHLVVGERVTIATFAGTVAAGGFSAITLQGFGSGAFNLVNDSGRLDLVVTQAVTAVPEPAPWLLLAAGVALLRWRRVAARI